MSPMEAQLRENYERKDTDELLELMARDTLTDTAHRVLTDVLSKRGMTGDKIEQARSELALIEAEDRRVDINHVERYWRIARYSFYGLIGMILVALYSHTIAPEIDAIVGFLIVACGLTYCVAVGFLAKALKRSVVAWMLLVLFVPLGIGKLIAFFRLSSLVSIARKEVVDNLTAS